jgi:hypothetical protein
MENPGPRFPERHPFLHHYTARKGLEGIIALQTLFATHYDYLNDKSEIRRMKPVLIREIQRQASDKAKHIVDTFYSVSFGDKYTEIPYAEPFITSFCGLSDDEDYERENGLLSQWRGYAAIREGGGFAIVFDTKKLHRWLEKENKSYHYHPFAFGPVVYEGDTEAFRREFGKFLRNLTASIGEMDRSGPEVLGLHFQDFVICVSRYKHRAFREEKEVRIIACPSTKKFFEHAKKVNPSFDPPDNKTFKEVFYRNDDKPTVSLFDFDKKDTLPIVEIIVGPHQNQIANVDFARTCVEKAGLDVKIRRSETPYLEQ